MGNELQVQLGETTPTKGALDTMNWTLIATAWIAALVGFLAGCVWATSRPLYNSEEDATLPSRAYSEALIAQVHRTSK